MFGPRQRPGLYVSHESGGLYKILTEVESFRTKHVKFDERKFPGTSGTKNIQEGSQQEDDSSVKISISNPSLCRSDNEESGPVDSGANDISE